MCWKVEYIVLIVASTAIDYYAGIQMGKTEIKKKRKKFLILSLVMNLGLLFGFKYFNFFNDSFRDLFNHYNILYDVPTFNVLLPVGISFYTFQTLSYSIDIYRGRSKPERHFGKFALYVAFFPQLVAGPIERSIKLLPQFSKKITFRHEQVVSGLKLMLWGFFKKVVIADRLALFVGTIFNHPDESYGLPIILASILLHIQVYTDLSGYTDIARGAARVFGIDIIKNFNMPLFARSFYDFWKRWHISLTTWFTDYLYIPLGGSRVVKWRWYFNIYAVFIISGLWHGANWTYVIWGVLHGLYQLIEIWTDKSRRKFFEIVGLTKFPVLLKTLGVITTLLLVSFATLFFGAHNLNDSFTLMQNALQLGTLKDFISVFDNELILGIFLIGFLMTTEYLNHKYNIIRIIGNKHIIIRWSIYILAIILVATFGVFEELEFIYFQF